MLKKADVKLVLDSVRTDWQSVSEKDVAFAILCDALDDKSLAYRLAYRKSEKDAENFYNTPRFKKLLDMLEPFGIGSIDESKLTKEENKGELLKLLNQIDDLFAQGKIDAKDALKMKTDIRVKLNDKFDMEDSQKQRRIIIVQSKHDMVCPSTNRECTFWPKRKACCTHFGLIDPMEKQKENEDSKTDSDE